MNASSAALQYSTISYLGVVVIGKVVLGDEFTKLFHLIRFGLVSPGLEVEDFRYVLAVKDVMTAFDPALKGEMLHDLQKIIERDVRVRVPGKDPLEEFALNRHESQP
jgi:hypothetical protein